MDTDKIQIPEIHFDKHEHDMTLCVEVPGWGYIAPRFDIDFLHALGEPIFRDWLLEHREQLLALAQPHLKWEGEHESPRITRLK